MSQARPIESTPRPEFRAWVSRAWTVGFTALEILISPLLFVDKLRRYIKYRKYEEVDLRRWRCQPITPAEMDIAASAPVHLVLAGESFGEMMIMHRLTGIIESQRPEVRVSWTLRDEKTIEFVKAHRQGRAVALWPFDAVVPVNRWIHHVRPDLVVFIERFRYPFLTTACGHAGADLALINGRQMSDTPLWRSLLRGYYRWMLHPFRSAIFQQARQRDSMAPFLDGSARTDVGGDIKFDLLTKEFAEDKAQALRAWLEPECDPSILAAGSTEDPADEEFVLEAFKKLRSIYNARLLLAPRMPKRAEEAAAMFSKAGFSVSFRSNPSGRSDVYVLDTLGELAFAYSLCRAAYIGGSLLGQGHNVLEPVLWGIPTSYAMRRGHFEESQKACEAAGVGFRVPSPDALAEHWAQCLNDEAFLAGVRSRSESAFAPHRGALQKTVAELLRLIDLRSAQAGGKKT